MECEPEASRLENATQLILDIIRSRFNGVVAGFLTLPGVDQWLLCLLVFSLFGGVAYWIGLQTGLIRKDESIPGAREQAIIALRTFFHPALVEETIFRGLLLPPPPLCLKSPSDSISLLLSLMAFILVHPLNGVLFNPERRQVFTHPVFLSLAALLGIITSALYCLTASLWPCVVFHWLVVFLWTTRYGGLSHPGGAT